MIRKEWPFRVARKADIGKHVEMSNASKGPFNLVEWQPPV
jgi:hypothetical protein